MNKNGMKKVLERVISSNSFNKIINSDSHVLETYRWFQIQFFNCL